MYFLNKIIKKTPKMFVINKIVSTFAVSKKRRSLAQLVEQLTLNQWVQGSTPWRPTKPENHYWFSGFSLYFYYFMSFSIVAVGNFDDVIS